MSSRSQAAGTNFMTRALTTASNITLTFWMKVNTWGKHGFDIGYVMETTGTGTGYHSVGFQQDVNGTGTGTHMDFFWFTGGGGGFQHQDNILTSLNTWLFVAIVLNGTGCTIYYGPENASTLSSWVAPTMDFNANLLTRCVFANDNFADIGDMSGREGKLFLASLTSTELLAELNSYDRNVRSSNLDSYLKMPNGSNPETATTGTNWTRTGTFSTDSSDPQFDRVEILQIPDTRPRLFRLSPGHGISAGSSAPLTPMTSTPVGTSFFSQEASPRMRAPVIGRDHQGPLAPPTGIPVGNSWQTSTSPLLMKSVVATDSGAGAISPLNPPFWFPDGPDRPARRVVFLDPAGSAVVLRSIGALGYQPLPDAAQAALRRPRFDDAPAFAAPRVGAYDLSWARDPDQTPRRRALFEDWSALPARSPSAQFDLSWALQAPTCAPRPPQRGSEVVVFLPVFQPQAPSWLSPPADVVRRDVKPDDRGSAAALLSLARATDLSWARDPDRPAARRPPLHEPTFTPVGTAVTLSAWGWTPESRDRQSNRVVSNAFVSALVPPAIVTALVQGWIPEGPDRRARARISFEDAAALVQPLTTMGVTSWFPSSPDLRARARVAWETLAAVPGAMAGAADLSWLTTASQSVARKRPIAEDGPMAFPPMQTASTLDWALQGPFLAFRRVHRGEPAYQVGALVPTLLTPMPPMEPTVFPARHLMVALLEGQPILLLAGAATAVPSNLRAILAEVQPWRAVLRE